MTMYEKISSMHGVKTIQIVKNLLDSNEQLAEANRQRFQEAGVLALNLIASPGAGKTSLIIRTLEALQGQARIGVIEGDIAGSIDTAKVMGASTDSSILGGHGGGDLGLMGAFIKAVAENDPSGLLSGPDETLESHLMVFAAEQARREHRVVDMVE